MRINSKALCHRKITPKDIPDSIFFVIFDLWVGLPIVFISGQTPSGNSVFYKKWKITLEVHAVTYKYRYIRRAIYEENPAGNLNSYRSLADMVRLYKRPFWIMLGVLEKLAFKKACTVIRGRGQNWEGKRAIASWNSATNEWKHRNRRSVYG